MMNLTNSQFPPTNYKSLPHHPVILSPSQFPTITYKELRHYPIVPHAFNSKLNSETNKNVFWSSTPTIIRSTYSQINLERHLLKASLLLTTSLMVHNWIKCYRTLKLSVLLTAIGATMIWKSIYDNIVHTRKSDAKINQKSSSKATIEVFHSVAEYEYFCKILPNKLTLGTASLAPGKKQENSLGIVKSSILIAPATPNTNPIPFKQKTDGEKSILEIDERVVPTPEQIAMSVEWLNKRILSGDHVYVQTSCSETNIAIAIIWLLQHGSEHNAYIKNFIDSISQKNPEEKLKALIKYINYPLPLTVSQKEIVIDYLLKPRNGVLG